MLRANYHELPPHPALRSRVECYWSAAGDSGPRRVLPDGCVDFLFDASPDGLGARLVGAMTHALELDAASARDVIAVRFRPGGAHGFVRDRLDAFTDQAIELEALGGAFRELARGGLDHADPRARLQQVEAWLLQHLPARRDGIDTMLATLDTADGFRVDDAARELGCSRQHFTRAVRARTGLSPKLLARIVRLRAALANAASTPAATLAARHGYADQSHLARDVRELTGGTLSALR